MLPATTIMSLRREWDEEREQTAHLRPTSSRAALLSWQPDPWPRDGGMPFEIALALGRALTGFGAVAARADPRDLPGGEARLVPAPRRSLLQHVRDRLMRRRPDLLATTRAPAVAARLLDTGWAVQGQAVLVLSSGGDAAPALEALRWRHDWRGFAVRPPVQALVMPAVDGAGALLAAASEEELSAVLAAVERDLRDAGFQLEGSW